MCHIRINLRCAIIIPEINCEAHEECASQKACMNGLCADPCALSNPCNPNQECQCIDHQPVCIKGQKSPKNLNKKRHFKNIIV